jgi:hypothetical protein
VLESLTFYCTKTCPFPGIETLRLAYRKFPPSNQHDRKKGLPFQKTLKLKRESEASGAEGQEYVDSNIGFEARLQCRKIIGAIFRLGQHPLTV